MSSCEAVTFRVGEVVGWGMEWVQNSVTKDTEPLNGSFESTGLEGDGVASSVNHMGQCRLRVRVAKRRWMVCCCVWGCRTIFYTMCGALSTGIERSM